jgi:adenosylcobinamide-phosphate synthase
LLVNLWITTSILSSALLIDYLLGETKKFHPLVGFGYLALAFEKRLNTQCSKKINSKLRGLFSWGCLVLPTPILYVLLYKNNLVFFILDAIVLYLAVGLNSLKQHALNIYVPLISGDITHARCAVSMMVSRQTDELTESQISRATIESVLENGHDAVIASLFWFVIGGAPLVIIHRLSNTLDAMWGYKTEQYFNFGWFSAKVDDFLGWPSAKASALLYILAGSLKLNNGLKAFQNAKLQGRSYKSINGGWVMAAGATVLNIKLGGTAVYNNQASRSVTLGCGELVKAQDIKRSLSLVEIASWLFVSVIFFIAAIELGIVLWL